MQYILFSEATSRMLHKSGNYKPSYHSASVIIDLLSLLSQIPAPLTLRITVNGNKLSNGCIA